MADLVAGIEEQERNGDCAEEVHQRAGDDAGADPAHVFAEQRASRLAKLANLKVLHAKCFYNAIAADGFLENLAQIGETRLTVFRGTADLAAEFVHRPGDERK